uniref:RNA-dependent RNA polymerase n=1 Tax=Partiti-like adriusvirus TaxID=2784745 RepID=A0A7S6YNB5_9VIRU|nr:RNA-dependent RNA polymerase [Partiti-like adriusvirus]
MAKFSSINPPKLQKRSRLLVKDSDRWDNRDMSYFPIEYDDFKVRNSSDFYFAQKCQRSSVNYSRFVQDVISKWVSLFEEVSAIDCYKHVPFMDKKPFLNRVNPPQPENVVREYIIREYPEYSWLPDKLDTSDFRKQDRSTAINFIKPWGMSQYIDVDNFLHALSDMFSLVGLPMDYRNKSFEEFTEGMNNRSSSGFPLFVKKGSDAAIDECREYIHRLTNGELDAVEGLFSLPTVLFHRFTPKVNSKTKTVKVKSRAVFGYPMSIIGISEMLYGDLIDKILSASPFLLGKTRVELSNITLEMRRSAMYESCGILSLDINQMDQKLSYSLQLLTHAIIYCCNCEYSKYPNLDQNGIETALAAYEIHGPTFGNWGTMMLNNGGTKSGTRWNTLTNSLSLLLASRLFTRERNGSKFVELEKGIGDDQIKKVRMRNPLDEVEKKFIIRKATECYRQLALKLHPDKCKVCSFMDDLPVMGMDWDIQGRPNRPRDWVVSKLAYPERYRRQKFDERFVIRSASILFQIHRGLEYFEKLVVPRVGWLAHAVINKRDPTLTYYHSRDGPINETRLPLSALVNKGWRLF